MYRLGRHRYPEQRVPCRQPKVAVPVGAWWCRWCIDATVNFPHTPTEFHYSLAMKPRVYVETSVFSYLTARESASLIGATRQLLTRRWWERREYYVLYVSEVVIRECKAGDQEAANHRIAAVADIPLLSLTEEAAYIAKLLISEGIMPAKAAEDALHIAIAAVHKVDFLLSWNFKHIANPVIQAQIAARLGSLGLALPFICPPEDLAGEDDE